MHKYVVGQEIFKALEEITSFIPTPIYWEDVNSVILGANNQVLTAIGLKSLDEYIGKSLYELYPKELADKIKIHNEEVMRTGLILKQEEAITDHSTGKIKYFTAVKAPLYDRKGVVIGIIGTSIDISERKEMEEELSLAKVEAESANILKTNFIQNMQHDIRTPASSVWAVLDDIVKNKKTPNQELLIMLRDSAKQLLTICNDVIDFDRIEQGETPLLSKRLDIRQVINNTFELNKIAAFNKGLELICSVDDKIPLVLKGDEHRLARILINLIGNALKFTEKGFISLSAHLLEEHKKGYIIQFKLQDSGIGIPSERIDTLYEKFNRLNPANRNIYKGSGLGLRIVKKYVDDLGGEMNVQTELNKGTIFYIDIPFEKALVNTLYENEAFHFEEVTLVAKEEQQIKATEVIKLDSPENDEFKLHILLIEDDILSRKIAKILLNAMGYIVTSVISVKKALEALNHAKFDVVISDIGLPDGTGIDVINIMKKNKFSPNFSTPFIALTANFDRKTITKCKQAGFIEVLAKPMQTHLIHATLTKYVTPNDCSAKKEESPRPLGPNLPPIEEDLFKITGYPLFDVENGVSTLGSKDVLHEMIKDMVITISEDKQELEQAYHNLNWQRIEKLAHRMKGGALYCGVIRMRYACQYLERYRKAGYSALQENLYQQLLTVLEDTKLSLSAWLNNNEAKR
jgi:two-component system aerobic respiration control sensor histidine kinase ArcB